MAKPCLLSRSDLNIVSENDHRVGLCLCKYCSCGQHKCSYGYRRKASVPAVTSYQDAYRKKHSHKDSIPTTDFFTPNPHKMDLETTNQREYRPFAVESKSNNSQRPETPTMHFTGRTSYEAEYPNWGAVDARTEHRPKYPVRCMEVKFHGASTYQRSFGKPSSSRSTRTHSSRSQSTTLFVGYDTVDQSTTQRTFVPPSGVQRTNPVRRPKEEYIKVAAAPSHFTAKSRVDFQPPGSVLLDPHIVRKNISMYLP